MKIAICIPCYGDPKYLFVMSLLALQKTALSDPALEIEIVSTRNTLISYARQSIAEQALEARADYLLWLDADMTFPPISLHRLISHALPVVAANYRTRRFKMKTSSAGVLHGDSYKRITPKAGGLEEVDVVGFGVCLMKAEVFSALPKPWFAAPDGGEDAFFFRRLNDVKGVRPVVDHHLSAEVGHVAEAVLMF